MEKHIEIFCKQNPNIEIECPVCHRQIKIKTTEFLKTKYQYLGKCPECKNNFEYDTSQLFKKLEELKKFC